jgi:hypothetical protein
VIELPPGPYIGLVDDHNHRWVLDMGLPGPDAGKGGRYLIVPPSFGGQIPNDVHVGRCPTHKAFCAIRALSLERDHAKSLESLRDIKAYPLSVSSADSQYAFVDVTNQDMGAPILDWETRLGFWKMLHAVIEAEPLFDEFRPMYGLLSALGIEKERPFEPDERMRSLLVDAARLGRGEMLVSAFASRRPDRIAWPDRRWEWVGLVPDNGDFETTGGIDVEARDRWFAQAIVSSPAMFRRQVGSGSLYWLASKDSDENWLDGGRSYRLTVPLPVPAQLFWLVTVYDAETRSQVVTDQDQAALRSLTEALGGAGDQSVELFFGPQRPADDAALWIIPLRVEAGFRTFGSIDRRSQHSMEDGGPETSRCWTDCGRGSLGGTTTSASAPWR